MRSYAQVVQVSMTYVNSVKYCAGQLFGDDLRILA